MLRYRSSRLGRYGIIGLVSVVLIILAGMNAAKFVTWFTTVDYTADFADSAGISPGADVLLSGVRVGTVTAVSLDRGNARVTFGVDSDVRLGDTTTAQIRTGSLLGQRIVTVIPSGEGSMRTTDVIPVSRTSSPYTLNEAVDDLTTNTKGIDTGSLNASLDVLSQTMNDIAPDLRPTFGGLSDLSKGINARDGDLRQLLGATKDVTDVIAQRADKVNTLIINANSLLGVLVDRRQQISDLLANTSEVARQLNVLVAENEKQLGPTLDALNRVAAMLEKNRDNIGKALPGIVKSSQTQGEAVSSGPFYQAYVANVLPGPIIQPFLDRAFGLKPPAPFPLVGGN